MNLEKQTNSIAHNAVKVSAIKKAFETRLVLNDIELCIDKGQSLCLCGSNGAGKSTLLRIIAGLLEPDHGSIEICGYNLKKNHEKAKIQLGFVSHKSMVYPDLTVMENLLFFADLYGVKDKNSKAEKLLKEMKLQAYKYDRAGILSRGLLQRLSIARALIHEPNVLIMDEPFTGLDSESSKHLISVLNNFTNNGGSIIMTTHDIRNGISCCQTIVVLDEHKIILSAKISDIDTASFEQDYLSYARRQN